MSALRFTILLFLFAGVVHSAEWTVLHCEQGATISSKHIQQDQVAFQVELPHENAALVFGSPINYPLVIQDLTPMLRVKSTQAGLTLGAQIVLPKTIHPDTKRPITFLVAGSRNTGSGNWETLGFWDRQGVPNLEREATRIAALLRAELKIPFDMQGQYVRQLVLYVPGHFSEASNKSTVEMGSPSVVGFIAADVKNKEDESIFDPINYAGFKAVLSNHPVYLQSINSSTTEWISPLQTQHTAPLTATPDKTNRPATRTVYADGNSITYTLTNQTAPTSSPAASVSIRFSDGVLSLDDVPIGVRAIEYQGEPLALLRELKFNAVWLKQAPGLALRQEAQQAGIWLICPPPSNNELQSAQVYDGNRASGTLSPQSGLDSSYDNVLIWNIGNEGSHSRHLSDAQVAQVLQTADRNRRRPLICTARSGVDDYSRTTDILMMFRETLFSSLDLLDLRIWQKDYPTLARPGTAFWCTVQTQPSPKVTEQWTLFEGNPAYMSAVSYEQIKMQVYLALAAGAHGILFTSHTPLTGTDPESEFRRTALELANWELQLVEEWFAAGRPTSTVPRSNQSAMSSAVIALDRSRLLLPIWQEKHCQSEVGPAFSGKVRFVVPGIPETYEAYHLVPGRLLPLHSPRVAGGTQIELEEASLNSLIFFGEDGAISANIGQRAKLMGERTAYLACKLAELELAMTEQVLSVLKRAKDTKVIPVHPKDNLPLIAMPEYESMLRTTKEALDFAKNLTTRTPPDYARAYLQAERATRGLRYTGRSLWQEATRHDLNLCMTPVSLSFATLPLYLTAYQRTNGASLGENRLPSGDMEMRMLEQAGWEPRAHKVDGVFVARRDLSPAARRSGQTGLQLVIAPTSDREPPKQLETIPLWTATPPMTIRMGEMICVSGWIRIPQQLQSTTDGLMIFDSLGGEELALRFTETAGEWKEFAFYRNVPADGNYYVFIALGGIGEVHLDDIRVSAVQSAPPQAQNNTSPQTDERDGANPRGWQRLNPFQYLPPMPGLGQ